MESSNSFFLTLADKNAKQSLNNGIYFLFLALLEIQSFCFGEINGNFCSSQQYNLSPSLSLFLDYFQILDMNLKLLWKCRLLRNSQLRLYLHLLEFHLHGKKNQTLICPKCWSQGNVSREFQALFLIYKTEQGNH